MATLVDSSKIFINETEAKPNRYAANVLTGIVTLIGVVCILNELGIFTVQRGLVHLCLVVTILGDVGIQILVREERRLSDPLTKYIILSMVLILVMILTVLLNIHAVLAFVLPLLIATQYRSKNISHLALWGSIISCGIAPILSYTLGTWSLNFLTGYIQTFCKVTISATPGNDMSMAESIM